jgi:hypothetical protein
MDWKLAREEDRRMLRRIVALLFAFASLAERLCGLPGPVRGFVLRLLRSAEAIARDFVLGAAQDRGASVPPAFPVIPALQGGDSHADAMRLARSFRTLAVLLDRLADRNSGCRGHYAIPAGCNPAFDWSHAVSHFLVGAGFQRRRQPCCATTQFAVERRDSS